MPDILHDFPVEESIDRVFEAVSRPERLDAWWTMRSSGRPRTGSTYELWFGPDYDWSAVVTRSEPHTGFELQITKADADWTGTVVSFDLERSGVGTLVHFAHRGWKEANDHFRVSSFCWAMYLRLLKKHVEEGTVVPYAERLNA